MTASLSKAQCHLLEFQSSHNGTNRWLDLGKPACVTDSQTMGINKRCTVRTVFHPAGEQKVRMESFD